MNRKFPSKSERYFTTGLTMITSNGTNGPNIMTAEWVMQISYRPKLIGVFIHEGSQTLKNIEKTKEFGINVASQKQTTEVNIAGGYSGTELDKLKIKSIFKLIKSRKIKIPLIKGCIINAECKLVKKQKLGDHVMIVGKVVDIRHDESKSPLIYHGGRYFLLGPSTPQDRVEVNVSKDIFKFFKNIACEKFVVKCVGVVVRSKNKVLVISQSKTNLDIIPFTIPVYKTNQRKYLIKFLKHIKLDLQIDDIPTMKRLILKNNNERGVQRVNFVLYKGKINKSAKIQRWVKITDDRFISVLI